jgi:hypothetical protein
VQVKSHKASKQTRNRVPQHHKAPEARRGELPMKKFDFLAVVLCSAVLTSAAQISLPTPQNVIYDFDKNVSFSKYKTYKWVDIPSKEQLDELTSGQLIGTLQVELVKKGLSKVDTGDPDLYLAYQISNASQKQLKTYAIGASYGSAGGGSAAGSVATTVHSGQLILLMFDAGKKQLVWRGEVSNAIDADTSPEKKQKHMTAGIEKLLKHYPPPQK